MLVYLVGPATLFGGCSLNETDFELTSRDISGQWVIASAPAVLKTNHVSFSIATAFVHLREDQSFTAQTIPVNELTNGGGAPPLIQWSLLSGDGRWWLTDRGTKDRHIWRITLELETKGLQLSVRKKHGRLVLVYQPDPDREEQVIFHRAKEPG